MKMKWFAVLFLFCSVAALAQQPQVQDAPTTGVNAKWANGVAPGYAPTAGSSLTLNLSAGTAFCGGSAITYAGGTLTMTGSTTNNIYLNTASSCAPAVKTSAFAATDIPIAIVTTTTVITAISDLRTMFFPPGSATGGLTSVVMPSDLFSSSGSPVETVVKQNQNADYVWQGPPSGAYQTPTIAQSKVCALSAQASPFVCAWNGAPVTGNFQLINIQWLSDSSLCAGGDNGAITPGTVSDGGINTFTTIDDYINSNFGAEDYKKESATGGATSVSIPFTGSSSACAVISLVEISGSTTVNAHSYGVNNTSCAAVTTTTANAIVACFYNRYGTNAAVSAGVGWNTLLPFTEVGSNAPGSFSEYQLETVTGTFTPTVDYHGNGGSISFSIAISAATYGGGGASPAFGPFRFTGLTIAAFPGLNGATPSGTIGATQVGLQVGTLIFIEGRTTAYAGNDTASTLYTVPAGTTQSLSCSIYVDCRTTVSTATVIPALLYTDHSSTAETLTGATATCTTLGTNSVSSQTWPIRAKAGTVVYFKTTIANSPDYDATASCSLMSTQ